MTSIKRDTFIAIALLALCGILWWASFDIRNPDYGTLAPAAWPRMILAVLTLFSLIYLGQSFAGAVDRPSERPPGLAGFLTHYRNPLWCYGVYFVFLATLPILGALIGGVLLVFALLTVMGGWKPRDLALHAAVAVVSMGFMWGLFTFGLRVLLPDGMILSRF